MVLFLEFLLGGTHQSDWNEYEGPQNLAAKIKTLLLGTLGSFSGLFRSLELFSPFMSLLPVSLTILKRVRDIRILLSSFETSESGYE